MSDDWDVIEELEFWDDYHAIYGPEPISRRKQKKINKYNKRKAKEVARKQKEAEDRLVKKVAAEVNAQRANEQKANQPTANDEAAEGCAYIFFAALVIIMVVCFCIFSC